MKSSVRRLLSAAIAGSSGQYRMPGIGAVRAFHSGQQFCRQRSFLEWWQYVLMTLGGQSHCERAFDGPTLAAKPALEYAPIHLNLCCRQTAQMPILAAARADLQHMGESDL
jgi:hypothetical protein